MRSFLQRLLMFVLLLGAMAFGLDQLLKVGLRKRSTDTFGVWNRLVDGRIQAQVLFLGSSRALMHFDAAAIGTRIQRSCYTIGMDGNQLEHQLPWLITYLAHNRPPQLLVQNVDLISLAPDTDLFFPSQYPPYLGEQAIHDHLLQVDPERWKDTWIPLYSFSRHGYGYAGLAVKGLLGLEDTLHDPLHLGFERKDRTWDGTFDNFKAQHPDGITRANMEEARRTLRTLIRTAQQAGSKVVLVYTPELKEMQELTLNRRELIDTFKGIAAAAGIPFWDFSDAPFSADRRCFYNSQHLNGAGVDLFTPMIADSIATYLAR
jgi:hypothetical protein